MVQQFVLNMLAGMLGGGTLAGLLYWALIGKLRERFVQKEEVVGMLPCIERLQRIERLEEQLPIVEGHTGRLISLEERLLEPASRMMDRLDKMAEADIMRDRLLDRTVNTLSMVSKNVEKMEFRLEELGRRLIAREDRP